MSGAAAWKRGAALAVEALASILMVLVSFGLFMAILYYLFPSGTPLREFMEDADPAPRGAPEERKPEAVLASLVRDVRCRRGTSVVWREASQGMTLFSQDAVQTFDRSEATIRFTPRDRLMLGSNSLVLVNRGRETEEQGPRTVRVVVRGDVRGKISGSGDLALELTAGGRVARIGGKGADFRLTHKTSRYATLTVYEGEAQVMGGGGGVRVPANHGVTLAPGGGVAPFALPAPPVRTLPERSLYHFRELPPKLTFRWSGPKGEYHFQLARDPGFHRLLKDLRVDEPQCEVGFPEKGLYYWRVSRLERGAEGRFGEAGRVELRQRLARPPLQVEFPPRHAVESSCTVKGSTEPGVRVFVNGTEAATGRDGAFSATVELQRGVNLIRVESVDDAGNATYESRVVYGKF